ncbi:helix-turn-helix domain-containing protein [Patescibacteria group bacterium]|jgi:excisionase family DNA binding protein|nr:helix-turn-helix domain-containing protein [Patescibacteria group bacterium]
MEKERTQMAHSIEEASMTTNLGRDLIYEAIRTGKLRAKKFGRRTIITDEDLRAFVENLPILELQP